MRTRWIPWVAVAVLFPAAAVVSLSSDAPDYLERQPLVVTDVAPGAVGTLGEFTIQLVGVGLVRGGTAQGEELQVPAEADLIILDARVDPGPELDDQAQDCEIDLIQPAPGGDIEWPAESYSATYYSSPDGIEISCDRGTGEPYVLEMQVLAPHNAYTGDAYLRVTAPDLLPKALHLRG